ncbi:very short patch repair endonuclease [Pseudomonas aeruginosa]|uniref:very short patch repair endonuclease n=1 Tax=Pseudomonas aeruginosa TaxID=287 RepID=UPI0004F387E9|nr:very short patch repair endonuclease [Pseudomonas aeruginosa]EKQ6315670.1 very short patch repair endonuclease [Pseudomonas aeruginosa]ELK4919312.1 very short patch repair endonuclease [Pseudomonas aeruginosa]KAB0751182.1 very short patch repair endonuclease [Pseudomonas aeruginosa]MBG4346767.1 very short patch repair endonuclease [Pseudomonas aeruginosa]MBG5593190.1 very short patch repair endonuclease [Pseudomonas aeruginosa]
MADNMTPEQRHMTMSKIRSRDTKVELAIRKELHKRGYRFRVNVTWLAGKPDVVFTRIRLAIFIDGDFWHGWSFNQWSHKLAPYWREKISGNITRDLRLRKLLRNEGWTVLRIWEHEIKKDFERSIQRIETKIEQLRKA